MRRYTILFITFTLLGIGSVVGLKAFFNQRGLKPVEHTIPITSSNDFLVENPPKDSLKGKIIAFSGELKWQSRVATDAATIQAKDNSFTLQQGEGIEVGKNGQAKIEFASVAIINTQSKSKVYFVQTLPTSFLVSQTDGAVNYVKTGNTPLSIRALHLLVKQNDGEINIKVNSETNLIAIDVLEGSITIGFNDLNYESHIFSFNKGQRITFNDSTRSWQED